jgi:hypothetical protein
MGCDIRVYCYYIQCAFVGYNIYIYIVTIFSVHLLVIIIIYIVTIFSVHLLVIIYIVTIFSVYLLVIIINKKIENGCVLICGAVQAFCQEQMKDGEFIVPTPRTLFESDTS